MYYEITHRQCIAMRKRRGKEMRCTTLISIEEPEYMVRCPDCYRFMKKVKSRKYYLKHKKYKQKKSNQ